MQLRSGRIIHMTDEVSNVNGGSSTNDSILVIVQSSDVTSRSKCLVHSKFSRDYNVDSTSNASNSMAIFRQHVEESHHDLVNLLTQQMATILNPMMADHESKFERLARQVGQIARILDYDKGERHDVRGNNEGFENIFQNENKVLNRENLQIIPRGQNADDVLARLHANHGDFVSQVRSVYPGVGDGLLEFLMQQKLKDRDVSLCPQCNAVFDAEAAAIFEKEGMKKELAHREEQARQKQPIRRVEGQSSKAPQQNAVARTSRSQAIGVQWIQNC
ncbi:hypothetical protein Ahy_B08g093830 isoform C [Arachis hypogaea]|uniref:Uncharacterized protein n=1 Tax=Arachis hypogaea TaxID=3818 RepID=A0A444Y727_ARAHY|nr:hypothetical protein Ahy_B08g093830 isoform C [Arachis hypogaea]